MTNYRRNVIPGACYFFTVNLFNRRSSLLTDRINSSRSAFRAIRLHHPFVLDAIVVLPDHLHTIWTLRNRTPISPRAGVSSRLHSLMHYHLANSVPQAASARANEESGNPAIGNIPSVTMKTSRSILITSITILCTMAMRITYGDRRIRHSTGWSSLGVYPKSRRATFDATHWKCGRRWSLP